MPMQMKAMIADTFVSMAKEKNIDKITVKDLVETCHISRQTFYYHFQDMMDVIQWSLNRAPGWFSPRAWPRKPRRTPSGSLSPSPWTLERCCSAFCAPNTGSRSKTLWCRRCSPTFRLWWHQRASKLSIPYSDLEVALHFFSFGIVGLLLENCGKRAGDPDQLADQMYRLISGKMLNSLFQD